MGGSAPSALSSGMCHTLAAVTSFPLSKVTGQVLPLLPSLSGSFFYSLNGGTPPPLARLQGTLPSLLHVFFFFFFSCLFISAAVWFFPFFSLGGSQSVQGTMLICPRVVCGSTACHLAHLVVCFFQEGWKLASGGVRALLVSAFNVEWRCYVLAGGVELSEICLFFLFFPARRISSISPRFYFRKHAFCFLPLVTILE
jgi:hypothetical protein